MWLEINWNKCLNHWFTVWAGGKKLISQLQLSGYELTLVLSFQRFQRLQSAFANTPTSKLGSSHPEWIQHWWWNYSWEQQVLEPKGCVQGAVVGGIGRAFVQSLCLNGFSGLEALVCNPSFFIETLENNIIMWFLTCCQSLKYWLY